MSLRSFATGACIGALAALPAMAQEDFRPDEHAPISVMGDHYHEAGELMLSYRYMRMSMEDNRSGGGDLSPAQIASSVANRFFGRPMQPPTLRVVPTEMSMEMHMLGVMYAPSDRVTLMAMLNHVDKEMEHTTFAGPMGTTQLGRFTTHASGLGDTSLGVLLRLREQDGARLHLTAGLSIPTGDVDVTGRVLAPTGMMPNLRLPYPMQLGSGSYDPIVGLTYSRWAPRWSWGSQWRSVLRVDDNGEAYRLGDEHRLTAWLSRNVTARISLAGRLELFKRGAVNGMDPLIVAPVQTADPARQGATRSDAGLSVNFVTDQGHRAAFELLVPLSQHLDGPQLKTDWQLTAGYQYRF